MPDRPNPKGWVGGKEDFTFVRTLEGHMGINVETPGTQAGDVDWRRNDRMFDEAMLGSGGRTPYEEGLDGCYPDQEHGRHDPYLDEE